MHAVRVLLLGQGRIELDGQPLTRLMASKHQALVFYLAATGEAAPRGRLAALLWGDHHETAARANLRVALTRLRRWLPDVLVIDERQVGFAAEATVSVDWRDLAAAVRDDASPEEREVAAGLWRGPLLDGLDVTGSDDFESWLAQMRRRAEREALDLRRTLVEHHEAAGSLERAIDHARGLLEIDEADEFAHMALMRLLAARGRRTAALAQYEACRAAMAGRLGARPSADCYALDTRIHAQSHGSTAAAPAPAPTPAPAATPATPESPVASQASLASDSSAAPSAQDRASAGELIGRENEMALLIERVVDPECRWLTITGPPGAGKTRLAQAAVDRLSGRFRHGALWFTGRDAAGALRDAETLAQQVLEHVGCDRHRADALLLVLDNLETVAGVRALATLVLQQVPGIVVLATSRARVGGVHEWLLELGGLALSPTADGDDTSSPAAQMFAASARRLSSSFDPNSEADAVKRICARVGGLPLGLEIAARVAHQIGAAAVADRLAEGEPLTDPDRDRQDRHRSIDCVLQDSWALLDDEAQAAALRLAWLPAETDAELARSIGVDDLALARLRDYSWLQRSSPTRLAMHPLQQDFLRRRREAQTLAADVRIAVARHLRAVLPPVMPLGDLSEADHGRAEALAGSAACSAPVIDEAAAQWCADADMDEAALWVDRAVALLTHAGRQGEAASLLAQALTRAGLPRWLATGWALRRGELLAAEGAATASLGACSHGFAAFGLGEIAADRGAWASLPRAVARLLTRQDWPPPGPAREGFERLLLRSLVAAAVYRTFSPDPMPAIRLGTLADMLARRLGRHADLRHILAGWAMVTFGHPRLARHQEVRTRCARQPAADPRLEALNLEGHCALRMATGRWAGLSADLDDACSRWRALRNVRHEVSVRSLGAKLAFYEGRLVESQARFAEISEFSLRFPGESWRAWGPVGQVEVVLCLESLDDSALQRLFERASRVITEMEVVDAAYNLRRQGLAARLAFRRGDFALAREAVTAGCAAASRLVHCGFWAHEGYANLGDTLLALRQHEAAHCGVLAPLDLAWHQLMIALEAHVRRFPPAASLLHRQLGQRALQDGASAGAVSRLRRAVDAAQNQGMRLELARSYQALADMDIDDRWDHRARSLWQDIGCPRAGFRRLPARQVAAAP